jgi:hypothetical protein
MERDDYDLLSALVAVLLQRSRTDGELPHVTVTEDELVEVTRGYVLGVYFSGDCGEHEVTVSLLPEEDCDDEGECRDC